MSCAFSEIARYPKFGQHPKVVLGGCHIRAHLEMYQVSIKLKFQTTLLLCLNLEHFQNNGVYFYMYNNKDQR